jgi:ABC-type uncharacterized transport system substrate-binding protein
VIERYSGEGRAAHYPDLARQIVSQNPDLIIAIASELVQDVKAATSTIPIVGAFGDQVLWGIASNLARPGGNITGVSVEGAEGLYVNDEPENLSNRRLIVELAAKGRLPTIYAYRQLVEAGGLMAYGIDLSDLGHRIAYLADKILKGAKPGEIPIYQPTKFELSINLKTAKTLGIELPPLLVARADNVIE